MTDHAQCEVVSSTLAKITIVADVHGRSLSFVGDKHGTRGRRGRSWFVPRADTVCAKLTGAQSLGYKYRPVAGARRQGAVQTHKEDAQGNLQLRDSRNSPGMVRRCLQSYFVRWAQRRPC
jgi:hypothetical protein